MYTKCTLVQFYLSEKEILINNIQYSIFGNPVPKLHLTILLENPLINFF